jgi:outer membrane receptor protein involved in Fe transport
LGLEGTYGGGKLKLSSAVKHYHATVKGYTIDWTTLFTAHQTLNAFAYNVAGAYKLTEPLLLKASYEHAARLPEAEEAFGDLMLVKPNPFLTAEKSENFNLGILNNTQKWDAELTGFFRAVDNVIYLRSTQFYSTYQNLLSANISGVEGAVRFCPSSRFTLHANATYQDLRNQSVIDNSTINNERYKNARIPNVPYLFINGGAAYRKEDILKRGTTLQLWWNTAYTHEYFLYWEVDGARELKNRIPTQWLQYAGVSYNLKQSGVSFSFEVNNVFDRTTYDNFKVQLPGRAYSIKLRFYKSKNHINN